MSRPTRILQKRFVVFCEGDTEYNYIDRMRKNQGVKLVLKPFNMHGGGYSNFLNKIRKEASSNCLAKFNEIAKFQFLYGAIKSCLFLSSSTFC